MRNAANYEQFGLSFVAGYADTLSFIAMSGLFTAHVTGNMVLAAAHVSGQGGDKAISNIVMILVFMLVVGAVTLLARARRFAAQPLARRTRTLLIAEAVFLLAFWWAGVAMSSQVGFPLVAPVTVIPVAALGVAALAIQNALPRLAGSTRPATTVMTGNLTQTAIDLATRVAPWIKRDHPARNEAKTRLGKMWPGVLGFFVGAALAAPLTLWLHFQGLAVACVALVLTMPAAIVAADIKESAVPRK